MFGAALALASTGLAAPVQWAFSDGLSSAHDPATSTDTTVTGTGSIEPEGDSALFNFHAVLTNGRVSGSLTYSDFFGVIDLSQARIGRLTVTGEPRCYRGVGNLDDGTRVTFHVNVTDNSVDGSTDTFSITVLTMEITRIGS